MPAASASALHCKLPSLLTGVVVSEQTVDRIDQAAARTAAQVSAVERVISTHLAAAAPSTSPSAADATAMERPLARSEQSSLLVAPPCSDRLPWQLSAQSVRSEGLLERVIRFSRGGPGARRLCGLRPVVFLVAAALLVVALALGELILDALSIGHRKECGGEADAAKPGPAPPPALAPDWSQEAGVLHKSCHTLLYLCSRGCLNSLLLHFRLLQSLRLPQKRATAACLPPAATPL